MTPDILPWQMPQWQQLMICKQQNRLPHALLLVGTKGLGKKQFARALGHALLCQESDVPCGQCHACQLMRVDSHPDFLWIEPQQAGHMIKIEQMRELIQLNNVTTLLSGRRVIIIQPAHALNMYAANALLKTLEEPAPNTVLVLISDQSLRLPATIVSRCQKIRFHKPTQTMGVDWLAAQLPNDTSDLTLLLNVTGGAPLNAKEWVEQGIFTVRQELYHHFMLLSQRAADPLQLAVHYQEFDLVILLTLLFSWLQDLLRFSVSKGQAELINTDCQVYFEKLMLSLSCKKILDYLDHVKKIYAYAMNSLNLNRQLVLEELFIRWVYYAAC